MTPSVLPEVSPFFQSLRRERLDDASSELKRYLV
jgi:hypothetical protein